jgi:hypothetical protein
VTADDVGGSEVSTPAEPASGSVAEALNGNADAITMTTVNVMATPRMERSTRRTRRRRLPMVTARDVISVSGSRGIWM